MSTNKRSFKLVAVGKHENKQSKFREGRYMGRDPATAAKKAFNQLCRLKRIKGQCTLNIAMQETTANSKKKIYTYTAKRFKLPEEKTFKKGTPNEYTISYDSNIHTNKDFNYTDFKKGHKTRGRMKSAHKKRSPNNSPKK